MFDTICPKCKRELSGNNHFFCTFCGFKFEKELSGSAPIFSPSVIYLEKEANKHIKRIASDPESSKYIAFLVLAVIFIFSIMLVSEKLFPRNFESLINFEKSSNKKGANSLQSMISGANITFDDALLLTVPEEVDAVIQLHDIHKYNEFLSKEIQNLDLVEDQAVIFLKEQANNNISIAIVFATRDAPTNETLQKFTFDKWHTDIVGGKYLITTNDPFFVQESRDSFNKIKKSILNSAKYISKSNLIEGTGQLRAVSLTENSEVFSKAMLQNSIPEQVIGKIKEMGYLNSDKVLIKE